MTHLAGRWWRLRDQSIDLSIQDLHIGGRDHVRHNEIAALDEMLEMVVADEARAWRTPTSLRRMAALRPRVSPKSRDLQALRDGP